MRAGAGARHSRMVSVGKGQARAASRGFTRINQRRLGKIFQGEDGSSDAFGHSRCPIQGEMASRGGSGWILGKFLMERVVQPWHSWNPHSWRDLKSLWMWHLGTVVASAVLGDGCTQSSLRVFQPHQFPDSLIIKLPDGCKLKKNKIKESTLA